MINLNMKKYVIKSFSELDFLTKEFKMDDNQILFALLDDINNFYSLKQLKNKLILISNEQEKDVYCKVELEPRPISSDPNWEFNRTNFCFGSTDVQKLIFSNISFIHHFEECLDIITIENEHRFGGNRIEKIVSTDENLEGCHEILFLEITGKLSLTFFDCKLVNNTNKIFKIISRGNSLISFINCNFNGGFLFENLDKSSIINR